MDVDGYVTIIGRIKEMINVGGEKVTPAEVEKVLNAAAGHCRIRLRSHA